MIRTYSGREWIKLISHHADDNGDDGNDDDDGDDDDDGGNDDDGNDDGNDDDDDYIDNGDGDDKDNDDDDQDDDGDDDDDNVSNDGCPCRGSGTDHSISILTGTGCRLILTTRTVLVTVTHPVVGQTSSCWTPELVSLTSPCCGRDVVGDEIQRHLM